VPAAHVDEVRRPECIVHAVAGSPQLVVLGDHQPHLVDVSDPEFRCVRCYELGGRRQVVERVGRPDAEVVHRPRERCGVRGRSPEQQLVVVQAAVHVVAVGAQIIADRREMLIQDAVDNRVCSNDFL